MRLRMLAMPAVFTLFLTGATVAHADTILFNDGTEIEGVIKKVAAGLVTVDVGGVTKTLDVLTVKSMDFTTPHLVPADKSIPVERFLKDVEAQEVVRNLQELEKTSDEIRVRLGALEDEWSKKKTVTPAEKASWDAAREQFRAPLSRYQEMLRDLYYHVVTRVTEYDNLTAEAGRLYVGVRGVFNIGSSLIPKGLEKTPIKDFVPDTWYDTIYYNGYTHGWDEAFQKFGRSPAPADNN